jgi:MFS transporter, ACS family, tartrate transporter
LPSVSLRGGCPPAGFRSAQPTYIGLTLAVVGTNTARAVLWTIPTRFLTGLAAASGSP